MGTLRESELRKTRLVLGEILFGWERACELEVVNQLLDFSPVVPFPSYQRRASAIWLFVPPADSPWKSASELRYPALVDAGGTTLFISPARCGAAKLRGSVRPAVPTSLGRKVSLQRNCVVVLLIVGTVHKCHRAAPIGLKDRFHSFGFRT
jgi:hypothetical protein